MLGGSAIAILNSLGLLALLSIGIAMLQPSRLGETPGWRRALLMGLVFGGTVSAVMVDPVVIAPGAVFDPRGGPAMLAGVYGGPLAALVTAIMGAATRLWIGGAGTLGGVVGFAVYAAVGLGARWYFRRHRLRPTTPRLLALSLAGTLLVLPTLFLYPEWQTGIDILSHAWWMLVSCNVAGVLVLGTLLEQDWRRRQLEQELRQSESRSRAAAEAKTRFLASMSHEIRTPMNAVLGFVDLLRDSNLDGFQRRCTDQIRDAATGLLRIIDDILDYAKIDAGRVALDTQPTDAAALVEGCREMLLPQMEAKGIGCTLDLPGDLPAAVEADPVRLRQVLLNLLGNAVKFTDSGRIAIAVRFEPTGSGSGPARSGELRIRVSDTGIGMTPEERDRLFSPFVQGQHVGRGGSGLGLVISRMLVEAMGGGLTLETAPGEGTAVTIAIPVKIAEAMPESGEPAAAPSRPTALRVLVAEDVALNAEMLQVTLEQAGHRVQVVADGRQAVDAVRGGAFDLVLMDVQMPEMDGIAATRAIRAMPAPLGAIPIVALTAYASRDDLRGCLDAGMNDFLTKPLERAKLIDALDRWGGARGARGTPPGTPGGVARGANDAMGENVDRVGELLARLQDLDRSDRHAVGAMANSLMEAAGSIGFDAVAHHARRLAAASPGASAEALNALIEDTADAGRRTLDGFHQSAGGEGR